MENPQPGRAVVRMLRVSGSVTIGVMSLANRAYAWLLMASRGRIGASVGGRPVLVLETRGRRTGRRRRTPVQYAHRQSGFVVVASNAGRAEPPAWSLNLAAEPVARAFLDRRWVVVPGRGDQGDDRERLWQALSQGNPWLARAAARAVRDLPVIVLRPLGGKAAL